MNAPTENKNKNLSNERLVCATVHTVEDARTKKDPRKSNNDKKDRKTPSKGKTVLLTVMITLLCFSLTLVAADLIGSDTGISVYTNLFLTKKNHSVVYYAVYATKSEDMSISYKNAAAIREEGGAGYVMKTGGVYYVVLNVYSEETDAKKVAERKSNYGITEIEILPFDIKKQPSLSAAGNSKDLYREAYRTLYETANDLAAGNYQKEDMLRAVIKFKQKVVTEEAAFAESVRGKEDQVIIEYKVLLAEIRSAFENLEQNADHLVSDARYYAAMIVRSFALFSQKYFD